MFSKRFCRLALYSLVIIQTLPAQQIDWIKVMQGDPGTSLVDDVTSDPQGNVYVVGHFDGSIDFDPNADKEILNSAGSDDIFIQKLDPEGNLVWVHRIGGAEIDRVRDIEVDDQGNIFVAGAVFGSADLDPGPGTVMVDSETSGAFILKLDNDGNYLWSYHTSGSGATSPFALEIDLLGNIYSTGVHFGSMDFGDGDSEYVLEAGGVGSDIYVLKISDKGEFLWAESFGSPSFDRGLDIIADGSGAYVRIDYFGEFAISSGGRNTSIPHDPRPGPDAAILKFDADGKFLWFKSENSPGFDRMTVHFAEEPNVFITSTEAVTRHKPDGDLIDTLKHPLGGLPILDNNGLVIRAGSWTGRGDFDPGPDSLIRTSSINIDDFDADIFAMRFDSAFMPEWIVTVTSSEQLLYRGGSLNTPDVLYFASEHQREISFSTESDTIVLQGDGSNAAFVVKLRTCSPTFNTISAVACRSYQFGDRVLLSSGIYRDTLVGASGCDSIIELDLEIEDLEFSVLVEDTALITTIENATYQWLDCTNAFSPVPGATAASFSPPDTEDFAVQITQGSCRDTSDCFGVMTSSSAQSSPEWITLFPNPATAGVTISIDAPFEINYEIYNTYGSKIREGVTSDGDILNIGDLATGSYIIVFNNQDQLVHGKFIKL